MTTLQGYLNVVPTYSNKAKGTALAATDYTVTGPNNSLDFRTGYRLGERIELTVTAKENSAWTDTVVAQFKTSD